MGLILSQIKKGSCDFDSLDVPKKGLSLSDIQSQPKKVDIYRYINNSLTDISNAYVLDLETYNYNSRIRMIQLFDIKNKTVHIFVNGDVEDQEKVLKDIQLKKQGFKIEFHIYNNKYSIIKQDLGGVKGIDIKKMVFNNGKIPSELLLKYHDKLFEDGYKFKDLNERIMFFDFIEFLKANPKTLLGHNMAHFDIGIIGSLIQEFGIKGFHIFEYTVGSSRGERRVAFSYTVSNDTSQFWFRDSKRYDVIDSLMVAQSLQLPSISLKALSKNTIFEKKDVDYRVFEKDVLKPEWVLYGVYDVLSVPDVLQELRGMWEVALKQLKINFMQSQRVPEHVLMKGAGGIAESYLSNLFGGAVSLNAKDHLSKYFGGCTRAWDTNLGVSDKNKAIRYLDFTSFYPFSLRKQKIFDVLNGSCIRISNTSFSKVKDKYDDFLYSTVFEVKAKEKTTVIVEGELQKDKHEFLGIGFFRSFDKTKRIGDLEHQFIVVNMKRGDSLKLTKTEYEITKTMYPDSNIIITKVVDGIIPTSEKKSEEYIGLYAERQRLKKKGDKANLGYKILLNASYGKLAESRGRWFNLACASAITGYCRAHLIKTVFFARKNNVKILYSDTDSIYTHGSINNIKKVQEYAETFNEHPQRFGEDNLKDEGEDIVAFWGIKRKRYLKVINENGKNHVVIKGENGNQDIRWRDVFFRLSCITNGSVDIKEIEKRILNNNFKLKTPNTDDFELACKEMYEQHRNKRISELLPVKSNALISMMMGVHFKKSTTYESGLYYAKICKAWEEKTGRKAWIGCFFKINRDYSFNEKEANDFSDWGIKYSSYVSQEDKIPFIYASQYNKLVEKKINLDTIRLKTREGIKLGNFESDDDKKAVTFKILTLKKTSQSSRVLDIFGQSQIFRLSIPQDLDIDKVEFLKTTKTDRARYSNTTLFLTPKHHIESVMRINKIKMFVKDRTIFNIYRFISDLGVFAQKLVLHMLNKETQTKNGKVFQPLELNGFPRFTFITQADVYQPVTKEYARQIHKASFDSVFHTASINHFWNFKLLKYCELNIYDKQHSAEAKKKNYDMWDFERDTFTEEQEEGEYRSEIKFKLKRNYYETLSYIFALGNMDQEYFLGIISQPNYDKFKHIRKHIEFGFPSKLEGFFRFNERKCIVLMAVAGIISQRSLFMLQVYNGNPSEESITPLVGSWDFNASYPPINKKTVIWEWEKDRLIKKEDIEDVELEVMGFK